MQSCPRMSCRTCFRANTASVAARLVRRADDVCVPRARASNESAHVAQEPERRTSQRVSQGPERRTSWYAWPRSEGPRVGRGVSRDGGSPRIKEAAHMAVRAHGPNETARRTDRKTTEPSPSFDFREPLVAISEGVCLPCSYQSRGELVVGRLVVVVSRHALTSVPHHGLHDPRRQL